MAKLRLVDQISNEIDAGNIILIYPKHFDTIDHIILIDKLECYGVGGLAFEWMRN